MIGTIAATGLSGPGELRYYRGSSVLRSSGVTLGVLAFGDRAGVWASASPLLTLLEIVMVVALLLPIVVFVATAARFGSDERDRRFAALRLLGADRRATVRIAAGEALLGALAGVLAGALWFVALRPLASHAQVAGISVFAADIRPAPALAALVLVLVPLCAVAATVGAMRRVLVEPLAVSRRGRTAQRRLGWRLALPLLGFMLLLPFLDDRRRLATTAGEIQAAAGVLLALIGLTALLPWVLDALVARAPDGPTPWLLAVRRLRTVESSGSRAVSAISLAVAGAIALQMVFGAAETMTSTAAGADPTNGALLITAHVRASDGGAGVAQRLRAVPGVRGVLALAEVASAAGPVVTVASCPALTQLAMVGACRDGDVFLLRGAGVRAGAVLRGAGRVLARVPRNAPTVLATTIGTDVGLGQVLVTPGAAGRRLRTDTVLAAVTLRPGDSSAEDRLRDTLARVDPLAQVTSWSQATSNRTLAALRRALLAGAAAVLLVIGASLLVSAAEQLRERRRVLAELIALGVRRSTLAWSIAWQVALPVAIGLVLAVAIGTALGTVLMEIVLLPVSYDWGSVALLTVAGVAVVAAVTILTVPMLWRLTRSVELRTE